MNRKTTFTNKHILVLALAWLSLFSFDALAQAEKKQKTSQPATVTANSAAVQQSAVEELKNFKPDPQNQEVSDLHYELLQEQAKLERGVANKSLSSAEIAEKRSLIAEIQSRIQQVQAAGSAKVTPARTIDVNSVYDVVVTEKGVLKTYDGSKTYLTLDQFMSIPAEKQQTILQNPDSYVIVKHESLIPAQTISRTNYNSLPAEKQKMVRDNGIKITE